MALEVKNPPASAGDSRLIPGLWIPFLSVKSFNLAIKIVQTETKESLSVFLPGESQGWGSLVGFRLWGLTESDTTEAT